MTAFVVIGTYGPYEDSRFQRPIEGMRVTIFDQNDAHEAACEWSIGDPTCRSAVHPLPLCNDATDY